LGEDLALFGSTAEVLGKITVSIFRGLLKATAPQISEVAEVLEEGEESKSINASTSSKDGAHNSTLYRPTEEHDSHYNGTMCVSSLISDGS